MKFIRKWFLAVSMAAGVATVATTVVGCADQPPIECVFKSFWPDSDGDGFGDNNSDPTSLCPYDVDGDGEADCQDDGTPCEGAPGTEGSGWAEGLGDCNDSDANVNPAATETCNGEDDNCNLQVDEGADVDADGYTICAGDCNDGNSAINPSATETPYNGIDEDCTSGDLTDVDADGYDALQVGGDDCDDNDPFRNPGEIDEPYNGLDEDCTGGDLIDVDGDLYPGYPAGGTDCNDEDATVYPNATEVCDLKDNNCNGVVDEGLDKDGDGFTPCEGDCDDTDATLNPSTVWYEDADGDGYGRNDTDGGTSSLFPSGILTLGADPTPIPGLDGYFVGCVPPEKYVRDSTDCDDTDTTVYPSATEVPYDEVDQDCDGVDLTDVDGDGVPAEEAGGTDCDDENPNTNPSAHERCDSEDNDCNGSIDEDLPTVAIFIDEDGDGQGSTTPSDIVACRAPVGYSEFTGDCDDTDPTVSPAAFETCNGIDDNCDGHIDEGFDNDQDGSPGPYCGNEDCNDTDTTVYPGANETCNDIDDNCNGQVDENDVCFVQVDADADGWTTADGDCDDTNPGINPSATELCDGADNNCSGAIDEGVKNSYYRDNDGDTYGNGGDSTQGCTQPPGYVSRGGDCNDTDANVNPSATEVCDLKDNDCDGPVDEGFDNDGDGYISCAGDCDDTDANVHPGATELCNGEDDNCDGQPDESPACFLYINDYSSSSEVSGWTYPGSTGVTYDIYQGQLRARGGSARMALGPTINYTGNYTVKTVFSADTINVDGFGPIIGQLPNGRVLIISWEKPSTTGTWALYDCDPSTVACTYRTRAAAPAAIVKNTLYGVSAEVTGTTLSFSVNGRVIFSGYNVGATLKPRPGEYVYTTATGALYSDYTSAEALP